MDNARKRRAVNEVTDSDTEDDDRPNPRKLHHGDKYKTPSVSSFDSRSESDGERSVKYMDHQEGAALLKDSSLTSQGLQDSMARLRGTIVYV